MVKHLPAMRETWVRFLGQEDPLEKEIAVHSSTVAWQIIIIYIGTQSVKNLPAVQETRVRSLGWEGPLEKDMATHSSILVWKIPWTEKPGRQQTMGSQRVRHD